MALSLAFRSSVYITTSLLAYIDMKMGNIQKNIPAATFEEIQEVKNILKETFPIKNKEIFELFDPEKIEEFAQKNNLTNSHAVTAALVEMLNKRNPAPNMI